MADVVYTTALDDAGVRAGLARINGEAAQSETNWNRVGKTLVKLGGAAAGAFATANSLLDEYAKKHDFAARAVERHGDAFGKLKEDIGRDLSAGSVGNAGGFWDGVGGFLRDARTGVVNEISDNIFGGGLGNARSVDRQLKKLEEQDKAQKDVLAISAANKAARAGVLDAQISAENDPVKKLILERTKAEEEYNRAIEEAFALEQKHGRGGSTREAREAIAAKHLARMNQLDREETRLRGEASAKALREIGPGADIFESHRAAQEKLADEKEAARIAVLAATGREKEAKLASIVLDTAKRRREIERDAALTDQERAAALEDLARQQEAAGAATEAQFRAQKTDRSAARGVSGSLISAGDARLAAVLTIPVDREQARQTQLMQQGNAILSRIEANGSRSILN